MSSQFDPQQLVGQDLSDYGFARARDLAFDAVMDLWRRRETEGMKKRDIAAALDCDPAWITRSMRGPGNWTLRTFGSLVAALRGDIEIKIHGLEDPLDPKPNFHAYVEYPAFVADESNGVDEMEELISDFSNLVAELEPITLDAETRHQDKSEDEFHAPL